MPAPVSQYNLILQAEAASIQGQTYTPWNNQVVKFIDWNNKPVPFSTRKMPEVTETLDFCPAIFLCPAAQPESVEIWSTEREYKVTYYCDVVLACPGNLDMALHLDYELGWREQLRKLALNADFSTLTGFYQRFLAMDTPLNRSGIEMLYDYSSFRVYVENIEVR